MKIRSRMYNRETKDCELFVTFNEKELKIVRKKGFIQDEYICITSIPALYRANRSAGIINYGMKDVHGPYIGFYYDYCDWNFEKGEMEHNIIHCEDKKFVYGDDISLDTIQKRFIWDLIMLDILKPEITKRRI